MTTFKLPSLLNRTYRTIVFVSIIAFNFQFANSQFANASIEITTEVPTGLCAEPIYFQEWYAGIEVGGTGINVFVPIVQHNSDIVIDSVYFRNLKGKLIKKDGKYVATLENTSKLYTFKKSERPDDYPFTLNDYECVIAYKEKGVTKYFKVSQLNEVAVTYYENGPPTIYSQNSDSRLATTR